MRVVSSLTTTALLTALISTAVLIDHGEELLERENSQALSEKGPQAVPSIVKRGRVEFYYEYEVLRPARTERRKMEAKYEDRFYGELEVIAPTHIDRHVVPSQYRTVTELVVTQEAGLYVVEETDGCDRVVTTEQWLPEVAEYQTRQIVVVPEHEETVTIPEKTRLVQKLAQIMISPEADEIVEIPEIGRYVEKSRFIQSS